MEDKTGDKKEDKIVDQINKFTIKDITKGDKIEDDNDSVFDLSEENAEDIENLANEIREEEEQLIDGVLNNIYWCKCKRFRVLSYGGICFCCSENDKIIPRKYNGSGNQFKFHYV